MKSPDPASDAALRLAHHQHGIVSRRQLIDEGIAGRTIAGRVTRARLFPVFRGVYLVGRRQLTHEAFLLASVLAAGDRAVLGSRTAAAVWGFLEHRNPAEVLRSGANGRVERAKTRVEGEYWWPRMVIRHATSLPSSHVTKKRGIRMTRPERTLLDLASVLTPRRFESAFVEADRLCLLDDRALAEMVPLTPGRKGGANFRALVSRRTPGVSEARSVLESMVLEMVKAGEIATPAVNVPVAGYVPDFAWPEERVILEADGYEFHRGREAFEKDALRSNRLRALGWSVLRVTWRQLTERPDEVELMVRDALRRQGHNDSGLPRA